MRTLVKVTVPVEAGNAAVREGRLQQLMASQLERLKPEAAYFFAENGERTAMFVLNLNASADIPGIAEPFFMELNARVQFMPVMNADDLKTGLQMAAAKR